MVLDCIVLKVIIYFLIALRNFTSESEDIHSFDQ